MDRFLSIRGVAYPGRKLEGKAKFEKLYHYTSFDTFVKIWLSQKLRYGKVQNVNDIQESQVMSSVPTLNQMPIIWAYNDIRSSYKQISLTMDFDTYMKGCMSPMMWGHYGDKRKGVCIELDFNKLSIPTSAFAGPIKYREVLNKSTLLDKHIYTKRQIRAYIKKHKLDIFFTKQKCWSGENEYRIVSCDDEYLDISGAITAVYLTSCDSDECIFVENLVGDSVPVKFLHYITAVGNKAMPIVSDTRKERTFRKQALINTANKLNDLSDKSKKIYEQHKDDEDFVLGLHAYN